MQSAEELRTLFWKEDLEKDGGIIRSQYDEIKRVLANKDMEWVNAQYLRIKEHASRNVPYYSGLCAADDFPVLNKMQLLEDYEMHRATKGYRLPIHISSTSGSTGTPFAVEQDYTKRKRNIADLQVFGEMCNYQPRERMVFFRVINEKLHRTPELEEKENIYYIDSSDLSDLHLKEMIDVIIEKKPVIVFSYASTLVELGKYIVNNPIPSSLFSLRTVLTAGEGIAENDRLMLEKAFGCSVYRRYSDMELGILAQDNGNGSAYNLNWGSYYFECLKMDSDEPTQCDEVGRIVITDLFNYAFPMIRYDTGDLGIMHYPDEGELPYFSEIIGRKRDCVYTVDGRLISPAKIFVMMWGASGIKQWQFIQDTVTDYVIKINTETEVDENAMIDKFKKLLGSSSNIRIEYVDEIPVISSNKRRAVICNIQK